MAAEAARPAPAARGGAAGAAPRAGAGAVAAATPEGDTLGWLREQCAAAAATGAMGGDWEAVAHVVASELLSARPSDDAAGARAQQRSAGRTRR